ncbi:MAG: hydroxymyristoyl-ACP dehydratase [Pseudomonadota bacterium]
MSDAALERMPHRGAMLLLEQIAEMGPERIVCQARDHRGADYPLRLDGRLFAVALVELGAQAAAAHASLHGVGGAHTGLLLSLREVAVLALEVPDTPPLTITAERAGGGAGAAHYRFEVTAEGHPLVTGSAILSMQGAEEA